jgi:hypothetical protein
MFLLHKKLDVNVGTKVTGIFPSAILLANGCKWLRIQVNVPATDCLGRIAVFQVWYSTNMRFRWIALRGQFSTTMI